MKAATVFRQFSHGSYAVFASLHREVRIGVLSVSMLASVNIPKVQALQICVHPDTDEDDETTELSEVSVAGTMAPLTALQNTRIVSVITAQQIESSAAQSVNDLLKSVAGVDVRQRGGFGIQTDISIDGATFDQITILLNGVNISSPHTGHLSADFPVSLSDIERIEVLEGAASRVYGASAFGGAINIVTKRGKTIGQDKNPLHLDAGVQGGSYATYGADARFSIHSTPSFTRPAGTLNLSASYLRSDGATVNSDFQRGNAYLSGCIDAEDFRIDWQAGYSQKAYGANTFYSAAYPNQYERNRRYIISAGAETKGRIRMRPGIYWNRLYDHFELIRGTTTGENFHCTDVYGARIIADLHWVAGRTAVGAEVHEEGIYSTTLGRPIMGDIHKIPGEDLYYNRHDNRTNLSFNIEHNILFEHFTASFGVLAFSSTHHSETSALQLYPGIDLAYTLTPHWRLFASYNKGFRLPTFTDLYYKSPTLEGNRNLKAEESHSFQFGVQNTYHSPSDEVFQCLHLSMFQFSAKVFYHRGTNLIDWVMYTPTDVFHSANFDLDNMGLQAQATCHFPTFNLQLAYTFLHQQRHDDTDIYKSNYAMEYLRHKAVATLEHQIYNKLSASWTLRWQDRMGNYLLYENGQSAGRFVPYNPYTILDLKLRWKTHLYELWAEGTNLTNQTYYDLGNIPQPGLMIIGGVRVKL